MYVQKSRSQISGGAFLISAFGVGIVLTAFVVAVDWFLFSPEMSLHQAALNGSLIAMGFVGAALWIVFSRLRKPKNFKMGVWREGVPRTLAIFSLVGAVIGFILAIPLNFIAFGIASCAMATAMGLLPVRAKRWIDTSDLSKLSSDDLNVIHEELAGESDRGSRVLRTLVNNEIEKRGL